MFGFGEGILVLVAPVRDHCLLFESCISTHDDVIELNQMGNQF